MNEELISQDEFLQTRINLETAKIRWQELQRFFASGTAIAVDTSLNLTEVGRVIAQDNATQLKQWMDAGLVDNVTDQQAQSWYDSDTSVWAVVIKPWVLVQAIKVN